MSFEPVSSGFCVSFAVFFFLARCIRRVLFRNSIVALCYRSTRTSRICTRTVILISLGLSNSFVEFAFSSTVAF